MVLAKSGYTSTTAKNYVVNAAAVYTGITYTDGVGFAGTLVGATNGGVTAKIEQTYRNPEVDGTAAVEGNVKGNKVLQSAKASIVFNLKELSAENLRKGLNGSMRDATAAEAPAGYKIIETKGAVEDTDYLDTIAIVGTQSGSDDPIIIILDNPFSTGALEIATEDNGEATVEFTYEAHATAAQLAAGEFPWRILYPAVA